MNYNKYLDSEHWKAKRIQTMMSRGAVCEICLSPNMINIHHAGYVDKDGKSVLNNENIKYLFVLCARCHGLWHKYHKLDRLTPKTKTWAIRILKLTNDIDMAIRFCSNRTARRIIMKEYTQGKKRKFKAKYMSELRRLYRCHGGSDDINKVHNVILMESMLLRQTDIQVAELVNLKKDIEIKCDYYCI